MNPATAQGLDPKLKETYDRVMGTQVNPLPSAAKPVEPSAPTPLPSAQHNEPIPVSHTDTHVFVATPSASSQNFTAKKSSKISPVIFIVAGLVFFAVYTVVWLKVFNIF